jgi:hypothetical protein
LLNARSFSDFAQLSKRNCCHCVSLPARRPDGPTARRPDGPTLRCRGAAARSPSDFAGSARSTYSGLHKADCFCLPLSHQSDGSRISPARLPKPRCDHNARSKIQDIITTLAAVNGTQNGTYRLNPR